MFPALAKSESKASNIKNLYQKVDFFKIPQGPKDDNEFMNSR